jgi:hypothetical protein
MKFDSLQAIVWAFAFLLPGFVWSAVYAMLIPRQLDTEQIRFMEFFTLSSINNAFWSWLIYLSYQRKLYLNHEIFEAVIVFVIVFLSPAAAAFTTAKVKQSGWSARFLDWLGFRTALHITTAWDFKLSRTDPVWVNVQLKNGDRIYGRFGPDSFAGDAGSTADLYLEKTLRLSEAENTLEEAPNQGIWIANDQIATIEFVEG